MYLRCEVEFRECPALGSWAGVCCVLCCAATQNPRLSRRPPPAAPHPSQAPPRVQPMRKVETEHFLLDRPVPVPWTGPSPLLSNWSCSLAFSSN